MSMTLLRSLNRARHNYDNPAGDRPKRSLTDQLRTLAFFEQPIKKGTFVEFEGPWIRLLVIAVPQREQSPL